MASRKVISFIAVAITVMVLALGYFLIELTSREQEKSLVQSIEITSNDQVYRIAIYKGSYGPNVPYTKYDIKAFTVENNKEALILEESGAENGGDIELKPFKSSEGLPAVVVIERPVAASGGRSGWHLLTFPERNKAVRLDRMEALYEAAKKAGYELEQKYIYAYSGIEVGDTVIREEILIDASSHTQLILEVQYAFTNTSIQVTSIKEIDLSQPVIEASSTSEILPNGLYSASERATIISKAKEFVIAHSAEGMEFDLVFRKHIGNWVVFSVVPKNIETDGAQLYMEKEDSEWKVRAFGTAFPELRKQHPELFE